jgi:RNA polymerase-associated protein LEO1
MSCFKLHEVLLPCLQGILQSQGRILRKMRFMPSSLTSNSHRLLTALVDSRHKKVYKVKNCITDIDPEREKEEKERVISN